MISLRELTKENYLDCIRLNLHPKQEDSLASNAITIAQSHFEIDYQLKVIYEQETVIGLLAFCHEDEPLDYSIYWLFRFMIDKDHQNKGYGTQVLNLLVEEIKDLGGKTLLTMHKPSNQQAGKLYRNFGFVEDGVLDDGDISLRLVLS
ncbi:GNAT family N-acetyltransferase [Vibrio alfacsensis]|uniref:GNAT family N-acetyltransferase n=1 Tax=Vibrio TaxID=662 RepID=UPI004067D3B8